MRLTLWGFLGHKKAETPLETSSQSTADECEWYRATGSEGEQELAQSPLLEPITQFLSFHSWRLWWSVPYGIHTALICMEVLHISEKSVTYLGDLPAPKQLCHKVLYFHILVETTDVSASRAQHVPAPPIRAAAHTHIKLLQSGCQSQQLVTSKIISIFHGAMCSRGGVRRRYTVN